jgi:short-subunit dehydrogenase
MIRPSAVQDPAKAPQTPIRQEKLKLRPIEQQTIVITGASSGIGLATARLAAQRGAQIVLAARSGDELRKLQQEIESTGKKAAVVVADVARGDDVHAIATHALERFGRIDTWVNNVGVTIFGPLTEISIVDQRRLFDVNFWGQVHGSLTAVEHLSKKGGALINIGSIVGEQAFPLQGMYSASKHAVRGFTDALRMELEDAGVPISVTLIEPSSIDTPFAEHARNYMDRELKNPSPSYPPEMVARAIIHAAEHPTRELVVGGSGWLITRAARLMPRAVERWVERKMIPQEQGPLVSSDKSKDGALYQPSGNLQTRGRYPGYRTSGSVWTRMQMRPWTSLAIGAAMIGGAVMAARMTRMCSASQKERAEHRPSTWRGSGV